MSKKDVVYLFSSLGISEDKIKDAVRLWMKVELVQRCLKNNVLLGEYGGEVSAYVLQRLEEELQEVLKKNRVERNINPYNGR